MEHKEEEDVIFFFLDVIEKVMRFQIGDRGGYTIVDQEVYLLGFAQTRRMVQHNKKPLFKQLDTIDSSVDIFCCAVYI